MGWSRGMMAAADTHPGTPYWQPGLRTQSVPRRVTSRSALVFGLLPLRKCICVMVTSRARVYSCHVPLTRSGG